MAVNKIAGKYEKCKDIIRMQGIKQGGVAVLTKDQIQSKAKLLKNRNFT